jgi:hypothetical protein
MMADSATTLDAARNKAATTLAVGKAIDREIDQLIRAASINVAKLKGSGMKENQLRNIVNVAAGSVSIEEVTNFIRYQIGRRDTGKSWTHGNFGQSVISDIEKGAVKVALDAITKNIPDADPVTVRSRLIALYLGYLNRCFIYASKTDDWTNLSSNLES